MLHEIVDSERDQLLAKVKEDGHMFIVWFTHLIRIRRKKAMSLIRASTYASYGYDGNKVLVFYTLADEDEEAE